MKKLILTFALAVITSMAFAQGITFGIKGGVNSSILNYDPRTNSSQPGFNAGAVIDIGLHNWSIQPGVFYTTKGEENQNLAVVVDGSPTGSFTQHIKLNYVQVPVNFLYHIHAGPIASIYLGAGPYFAYGISGKIVDGQQSNDVNFSSKSETYLPVTFKNPDIGAGFLAGVLLAKKFSIDIGYDYGLSHISNDGPIENRVVHVSVGYMFL